MSGPRGPRGRIPAGWALTLGRAGYGVALLCAPATLIRLAGRARPATAGRLPRAHPGHPTAAGSAPAAPAGPGSRERRVARVLGVRHLLQAALTGLAQRADPASPAALACGAAVDLTHGLSMVALAAADRRARRVALTDGAVETAFAAAGVLAAGAARAG